MTDEDLCASDMKLVRLIGLWPTQPRKMAIVLVHPTDCTKVNDLLFNWTSERGLFGVEFRINPDDVRVIQSDGETPGKIRIVPCDDLELPMPSLEIKP